MCGIFAVHGVKQSPAIRTRCIALSKRQRHRGPDWSGCFVGKEAVFVHERLAIVGVGMFRSSVKASDEWSTDNRTLDTGAQPLVSEDGQIVLAVNGEIYNHVALRASVGPDVKFKTHSDCEVIIPLVSRTHFLYIRNPCTYPHSTVPKTWKRPLQPSRWHVLLRSPRRVGHTLPSHRCS
jgi:asparagine synthase (glutamine-hydrolysing)